MALQYDNYGFIIGERRFKELNGNVGEIDKTTKEILAVLTEQKEQDEQQDKKQQSQWERLIANHKKQNQLTKATLNQIKKAGIAKATAKTVFAQNTLTTGKKVQQTASQSLATNTQYAKQSNNREKAIDDRLIVQNKRASISQTSVKQANKAEKSRKLTANPINTQAIQDKNKQTNPVKTPKRVTTNERLRDEKGRFVGAGGLNDENRPLVQAFGKMSDAIWQFVQPDTSSLSPEIDAMHEVRDIIAPAGRGLVMMGRGAGWLFKRKSKRDELQPPEQDKQNKIVNKSDKEQRRLLRLILRAIGEKPWLNSLLGLLPLLKSLLDNKQDDECCCGDDDDDDGDDDGFELDLDLDRRKKDKHSRRRPPRPRRPRRPSQRPRHRLPESRKNPRPTSTPNGKKPPNSPKPPSTWERAKDGIKKGGSVVKDKAKNVLTGLKKVPMVGRVAALGLGALALTDYGSMDTKQRGETVGRLTGGIAGGWAGAAAGMTAGAAIGSVVPGVGTAIGGVIGGVVGGLGGGWLGDNIGGKVGEKIAPYGSRMVDSVSSSWNTMSAGVTTAMIMAGTKTYDALATGYEYTKNLAKDTFGVAALATATAKHYITNSLGKTKDVVVAGLTGFGNVISASVTGLGKIFDIGKNFVAEQGGNFLSWIKEKAGGIGESISNGASAVAEGVSGLFGGSEDYKIENKKVKLGNWSRDLVANDFNKLLPMLEKKAKEAGIPLSTLLAYGNIESHFRVKAGAGGTYQGLFQMGKGHMKASENRLNAEHNTDAAIRFYKENKAIYHKHMGANAEFTAGHAYLMHQQGAGAIKYLKNPNMNVVNAAMLNKEWQGKGRAATIEMIKKNGGNPNMTAGEFANLWIGKANALAAGYEQMFGGGSANTVSQNSNPTPPQENTPKSTTNTPATTAKTVAIKGIGQAIAIGDSIAAGVAGGKNIDGQAVSSKDSRWVLDTVKTMANNGKLNGQNVVLSSGASNEASKVNYENIEKQIDAALGGGASSLTLMSVADNWKNNKKKQTYKGKKYDSINAVLEQIASNKGVKFAKWNANSKDGYHATTGVYHNAISSAKGASVPNNVAKPQSNTNAKKETVKQAQNKAKQVADKIVPKNDGKGQGMLKNPQKPEEKKINLRSDLTPPKTAPVPSIQAPVAINANISQNVMASMNKPEIERVFTGDVGQGLSDSNLSRLVNGGYGAING